MKNIKQTNDNNINHKNKQMEFSAKEIITRLFTTQLYFSETKFFPLIKVIFKQKT